MSPVASVYRMFSEVGLPKGHEAHFHAETVEICFVLRGRLDWWVGDSIYEVHSGDVMVMPPGVAHGSVDSTLQPCEYYAVHLSPSELPPSVAEAIKGPMVRGLHSGQAEAGQLVVRLFHEHEQPDSCSEEVCRSLCTMLVVALARDKGAGSKRRISDFVQRAQEALLSVEESGSPVTAAAKQLEVSTVWLNRRFRSEVGESPGEWVRARKIIEAKKLLAFDGAGVTEVSVRLGFKSSQYFANAFKRETGVSPSAYRRMSAVTRGRRRSSEAVQAGV